jgi:hypothetical protein
MSFFLYFSLHFCSLYAQDDFAPAKWETKDGEIVNGFVQNRIINGKSIMVKTSENAKPIEVSAVEIQKIFQNDFPVVFSYGLLYGGEKHYVFLELITRGSQIALYEGKDEVLGKIFAIHKNDQFTVLNNKSDLRSSYQYLYGDCEKIDLDQKHVFTERNIVNTFINYNLCQGFEINGEVNPRKRWEPYFYVGPKLGLNYGKFNLTDDSYLDRGNYNNFNSIRAGIVSKIVFSNRISAQLDISYYSKKSNSDSVNTWPAYYPEVYSKVKFDISLLDFQFLGNYSIINRKNFKTDIGLGLSMGILINPQYHQEEIDPIDEGIGPVIFDFTKSRDIGFITNLGFTYLTETQNQIIFLARYIRTDLNSFITIARDAYVRHGRYQLNSSMAELSLLYLFKI